MGHYSVTRHCAGCACSGSPAVLDSLTVPFPFVNGSERSRADSGVQHDLAGFDLPVITRVSLIPRTLGAIYTHCGAFHVI